MVSGFAAGIVVKGTSGMDIPDLIKALLRLTAAVISSYISILLSAGVHFIHVVHPMAMDSSGSPWIFRETSPGKNKIFPSIRLPHSL